MYFAVILAMALLAQQAPIPLQIARARRVFVSNVGGEVHRNRPPVRFGYSGGPDRAYNQFYAALQRNGTLDLVPEPAAADLILEVRFTEPYVWLNRDEFFSDPSLRAVIRDPKTQTVLWGITVHIEYAVLQSNRDRDFDHALDEIVRRVLALRGTPHS
jgi:hypothetical protein